MIVPHSSVLSKTLPCNNSFDFKKFQLLKDASAICVKWCTHCQDNYLLFITKKNKENITHDDIMQSDTWAQQKNCAQASRWGNEILGFKNQIICKGQNDNKCRNMSIHQVTYVIQYAFLN